MLAEEIALCRSGEERVQVVNEFLKKSRKVECLKMWSGERVHTLNTNDVGEKC